MKKVCNGSLSCVGFHWLVVEIMIKVQIHDTNYEEGYTAGYGVGYNDRKQQMAENKKVLCTMFQDLLQLPLNSTLAGLLCAKERAICRSSLLSG